MFDTFCGSLDFHLLLLIVWLFCLATKVSFNSGRRVRGERVRSLRCALQALSAPDYPQGVVQRGCDTTQTVDELLSHR